MAVPDVIDVPGDAQLAAAKRPAKSGRRSTNKGRKFPPEPLRVDTFAALLAVCTPLTAGRYGALSAARLRIIIVLLFRTGIRISELLALEESDLNRDLQSILIRRGKGGKRRIVRMDEWAWGELEYWLELRQEIPPTALIPVIRCQHAGRPLAATDVRRQMRDAAKRAGLRCRVNPHAGRHGFSVEFYRETGDLIALQRQLGHANPAITSVYLRGIDDIEALQNVARRPPPRIVVPPPATVLKGPWR